MQDAPHARPFAAAEPDARRVALLDWAESSGLEALWSTDDARWATQQARAEAPADFRLARARHAARRLGERDERLAALLERRLWSGAWPVAAGLLGLALGLAMDRLGGRQLNLLALPLWGVLALQLLGYGLLAAWAAWQGLGPRGGDRSPALWRWLLARRVRGRAAAALAHWWRLSAPLQGARAALLWHAGLLGLSLGLVAGLYLRAVSHEFLIGWESTYLDAASVQRFADTLLAPASWLTGRAVPDVTPLRHGALQPATARAADWLHLLAATVALVALPRLLLALAAGLRGRRLARALPLATRSGSACDLRLLVLDPQRLWAGRLLGEPGERLDSPEGDRLWVTVGDAAPGAPPASWPERAWRRLAGAPAPAFDASLTAAAPLPAGWPAERRQLRALGARWPAALQPAWQRLLRAWEAPLREHEALAQQAMARALAPLGEPLPAVPAGPALPHKARNTVLGGALSGAATGLGADLASGGLSLGAGALVGAVVGGMAGAGLTEWTARRREQRSASADAALAEAAPRRAAELLGEWQLQRGLALDPARVRAAADAQDWVAAFHGEPAQRPARLQALLAACCETLLAEADAQAGDA
ncbi:MAG: DUF2868 domain-containing protein [Roseateles sp.]|uniref:DUF3482 domain-containing protein n=1 Tax=Roseateles sp. TaxID=1971397 RepID=UPI0039ECC8D0